MAILDLDRPDTPPLVLEESAAVIWSTIDGTRLTDGVVAAVADLYDAEPEVVGEHVIGFLNELRARGLVVSGDENPARATPSTPRPVRTPDVVLIGNYRRDAQQSMLRFTDALERSLTTAGVRTTVWHPPVVLGRFVKSTSSGLGKWVGYVDKWVLFVPVLVLRVLGKRRRRTVFHVCDHSNAPYLRWLPADRTLITCHDVIAIRGARGDADAHAVASRAGRVLQRWILRHLLGARWLTADSEQTLTELRALAAEEGRPMPRRTRVVPVPLNAQFGPMDESVRNRLLSDMGIDPNRPFILHVGSAHRRKNRSMLLRAAADHANPWLGDICFAGEPVDVDLAALSDHLGLADRVRSVVDISHQQLVALYSGCAVFVFPSLAEGFGWPVVEAQACGASVVASSLPPMPEVGGDSVVYADPLSPEDFAAAVARQGDPVSAASSRDGGFLNAARYDPKVIAGRFADVYRQLGQI